MQLDTAAHQPAMAAEPAKSVHSISSERVRPIVADAARAKRKRLGPSRDREENKRFRSAMDAIADDYVCPITAELPLDPVTAEDGHVYERAAIERWLQIGRHTSPATNLPMGTRLLSAHQVRSTVEKLVRTGAITGDKADRWREHLEREAEVSEWRRRAHAGDASAMVLLGTWHLCGQMGLEKSHEKGFRYCKQAADLGSVCGQASAGLCLVGGKGTEANVTQGICLVSAAAAAGGAFAANWLGEWHVDGLYGLPRDLAQARYWFTKVLNGSCATTRVPGYRERAQQRLAALDLDEAEAGKGAAAGGGVEEGSVAACPV